MLTEIKKFKEENAGTIATSFAWELANQYVLAGISDHAFTSNIDVYDYIFNDDKLAQACAGAGLQDAPERGVYLEDIVTCWQSARELQHGVAHALCSERGL